MDRSPDLARLPNPRLVPTIEPPKEMKLRVSWLKPFSHRGGEAAE